MAYLRIKKASLVAKQIPTDFQVTVPPILSEIFASLHDVISNNPLPHPADISASTECTVPIAVPVAMKRIGNWVAISNVQREVGEQFGEISIEDEVRECFEKLRGMYFPSFTGHC